MAEVETLSSITNIISSVGFPIVWAFVLFWYMNKQDEAHKQEVNELSKVIQENNIILNSLKVLMEERLKNV